MDYSWRGAPEKFADVARALGEDVDGLDAEEAAQKAVAGLQALLEEVDLNITLSDLRLTEDLIESMARDVMNYGWGNFRKNPRDATEEDVRAIYRNAL